MKSNIPRTRIIVSICFNIKEYFDVFENTPFMLKQRAYIKSSGICKEQISHLDRNVKREKIVKKTFIHVMINAIINDYYVYYLVVKKMIIQMIACVLRLAQGYGGNYSCRMIAKGGA